MRKILLLVLMIGLFSSPVTTDTVPTTVFFDDQALDPVLDMIENAQHSICIQMYNFTNPHKPDEQFSQVIDCLLNKIKQYPDKTI